HATAALWFLDCRPRPDLPPVGPALLRVVVDVLPELLGRQDAAPLRSAVQPAGA
ncbi:MAG: hypothetical protein RLZZ524_2430, partial [Pseudomonadota bacterium]